MELPATYRNTIQPDRLLSVVVDRLRGVYVELISSQQRPLYIGVAFGLGTLMSLNPVPVLDMVLAMLLLRLVPRLPRAPYMAAMATWNSFVMAPLYASMPGVGRLVMSTAPVAAAVEPSSGLLLSTLAGGVVISVVLVVVSIGAVTLLTHLVRRRCHMARAN